MFCPNCKSEYVDGIERCSDCDLPLVHSINEQSLNESDLIPPKNFVPVYKPISSQEVAMIKMIMEREQIPYYIKNDPLHKSVIFSIDGPGRIELFVSEDLAIETVRILKEELDHD